MTNEHGGYPGSNIDPATGQPWYAGGPNYMPPPADYHDQPPPLRKRPWYKRPLVWVLLCVGLLFAGCVGASVGISDSINDDLRAVETPSSAVDSPSVGPFEPAPKPSANAPKKVSLTTGQRNAIETADNYLDIMGFSKAGLARQLVGFDQYSVADATFAVNHIKVDWSAQAVRVAEKYLELQAFSRQGLIDQLVKFDAFTRAEATHGADVALR